MLTCCFCPNLFALTDVTYYIVVIRFVSFTSYCTTVIEKHWYCECICGFVMFI